MGNNILYIEDNPDNMMLVKRALEARGYNLLQAMNGLTEWPRQKAKKWI